MPTIEIQSTIQLESKPSFGPTIIVDPEFDSIDPLREHITALFRSYGMKDTEIARWTIACIKTPLPNATNDELPEASDTSSKKAKSLKEEYSWGKVIRKEKRIELYPERVGYEYNYLVPQFREYVKEAQSRQLTRRQKAWIAQKQERVKNVPQKADSSEQVALDIQMLLNTTLYEFIDNIFHKEKNESVRRIIRVSLIAGRLMLLKVLFPISPFLALGTTVAASPLSAKKILHRVVKNQEHTTAKRIQKRREKIPQAIFVHADA